MTPDRVGGPLDPCGSRELPQQPPRPRPGVYAPQGTTKGARNGHGRVRRVARSGTATAVPVVNGAPDTADVPFSITPDAQWGVSDGEVRAVLAEGDRLYVGGSFSALQPASGPGSLPRDDVAAFDLATGTPVEDFRADTNGSVRGLATDGSRLFVVGAFSEINGVPRQNFAAVDLATGDVDPLRLDLNNSGYAVAVVGSSLFVGGKFNTIAGVGRRRLARVSLTTESVDLGFNPRPDKAVWSIAAPASADTLWVGGQFLSLDGVPRLYATGLDPATGAIVGPAINPPGAVIDLDVADDGSRLFLGVSGISNSAHGYNTTTGAQLWMRRTGGNVQAIHVAGEYVYIGFHDHYQGNELRKLLALDPATGVPDAVFRPDINIYLGVWDITSTPTALIAGGVFTEVSGVKARRVAVFPPL